MIDHLDKEKLPQHIAIIMDGNGRWARKRNLERIVGHQKGLESAREIVKFCKEAEIKVLTLYAFSIENWRRPKKEVQALMNLLKKYIFKESKELLKNNIRLSAIGNIEDMPPSVVRILNEAVEKTKRCSGMIVNLALSYGGRDEIIRAIKRIVKEVKQGRLKEDDITEEIFSTYLFTKDLPDPDLLIRTSGEMRLSNFLLWQMAYTEIYVTEILWPDFKREDMIRALINYQSRERRFGRISEQLTTIG
ncbi:MAG TPA: isoprenyl transferase [Thermodesulfobacteriota bacterium]|nr:isoprenyl transferase [Thermodesulfobacteriota bacterium]